MPKKPLVPELAVTINTSPGLGRVSPPVTFFSSDVALLPPIHTGVPEMEFLKKDCVDFIVLECPTFSIFHALLLTAKEEIRMTVKPISSNLKRVQSRTLRSMMGWKDG